MPNLEAEEVRQRPDGSLDFAHDVTSAQRAPAVEPRALGEAPLATLLSLALRVSPLNRNIPAASIAAWSLATWLALTSQAMAGDCRLALVLALDVSGSVDAAEDRLQREGLARALLAPEVVRAFLSGGPVALYVFEWSGPFSHTTMPPGWQLIDGENDLARVAASLADRSWSGTASTNRTTALGAALSYAASVLAEAPDCQARTIDIAGNGESNIGPNPQVIYESGRLDGVTVNALIVSGERSDAQLVGWFEEAVLHGPHAFYVVADGFKDYERAMRAKLQRELVMPLVSALAVAEHGA